MSKLPSLAHLHLIGDRLEKLYTGKNDERLQFIRLYKDLVKATSGEPNTKLARQTLMGALVYYLEYIKQVEYNGKSPQKSKGLFGKIAGGSVLYTEIKKLLNITTDSPLYDDERLIYLNKFYWFAENNYQDNDLISKIYARLDAVAESELERIGVYAEGYRALSDLKNTIGNIISAYEQSDKEEEQKQQRYRLFWQKTQNPERYKFLKYMNFILQTCDLVYKEDGNKQPNTKDFYYIQCCNACVGIVLLVLLTIDAEYKNYKLFLSPERSRLFKKGLNGIGIASLKEMPREIRIELLRSVVLQIQILKCDPLNYTKIADEWAKEGLDIDELVASVEKQINAQEVKKGQGSWTRWTAKYLLRGGIGLAAAECTADYVLPVLSNTMVGAATGPIGLAVYLTGGALLMTQLGRLVSEDLIPQASSHLFAWVLRKVGGTIAEATTQAATLTFAATKAGFKALINHPNLKDDDKEFIQDWIDTLLELPNYSENAKEQIRHMLVDETQEDENKLALGNSR